MVLPMVVCHVLLTRRDCVVKLSQFFSMYGMISCKHIHNGGVLTPIYIKLWSFMAKRCNHLSEMF